MIRTLIVAEIRLYRDGLATILDAESDLQVVGTAAHWSDAPPLIRRVEPDVILLDVRMAEGRDAVDTLRDASSEARVVALSIGDGDGEAISWAEAGVSGYVTHGDSLARLIEVVRCVVRGEMPCSPRVASSLLHRVGALAAASDPPPPRARLTPRELEIVELIERGFSNKEIASELCIEVATVKNHVHNILEKLQVHRRTDAVARVRGRMPREARQGVVAG